MTALGVMGVTTPAERLTRGGIGGSIYSRRRFVPLTTILTCRLPHLEHTSRAHQSGTVVSAPYRAAISVGSGSTWWPQPCTRRSTGPGRRYASDPRNFAEPHREAELSFFADLRRPLVLTNPAPAGDPPSHSSDGHISYNQRGRSWAGGQNAPGWG
jgi:hypothetical protein